ncbi:hypothetical protein [Rugamonas sp.]|uniref:hypothetical protein n=1 Tax=Rugamonas sp. TaxID=1926287 RepID=UPI0025E36732|nr:hypothetical protein [Rugamonas sp.]
MNYLLALVILIATVLVVRAILRSGPARAAALPLPSGVPYVPALPEGESALHWSDGARYLVEVVNESRYQATLKELAGAHGERAADARYRAMLVPDDRNAYEDKAVAVFLNGRMAGYLATKDALRFRQRLAAKEMPAALTSCDAIVRGGGMWQGRHLSYVVVLDIEPFE